jgi:hypothetical protein
MLGFLKEIIIVNCLTQVALIILFFLHKEFFDALFVINQASNLYFWFLLIGATATLWLIWTGFTFIFGIRRLGYKAENATRKARK